MKAVFYIPLSSWYCQCSGVGHCNRYMVVPHFNLHCLDGIWHIFTHAAFLVRCHSWIMPLVVYLRTHCHTQKSCNRHDSLLCSSCFIFYCIYGPFRSVLRYGCGCLLVLTALIEKTFSVVLVCVFHHTSYFCGFWRSLFSIV